MPAGYRVRPRSVLTWGSFTAYTPGVDNYIFATATTWACRLLMNITAADRDGHKLRAPWTSRPGAPITGTCRPDARVVRPRLRCPLRFWPIYIETDDALCAALGAPGIKPAQMNWAVWATLSTVPGASLFRHRLRRWPVVPFGLATTPQSGQVVSNFTTSAGTRTRWCRTWPGFSTPSSPSVMSRPARPRLISGRPRLVSVAHRTWMGRHRHRRDGEGLHRASFTNSSGTFPPGFYIFATYRGSQTATGISRATFTVAGGYSGTVYALNADGGYTTYGAAYTLTASGGVFCDTLATGSSAVSTGFPGRSEGRKGVQRWRGAGCRDSRGGPGTGRPRHLRDGV